MTKTAQVTKQDPKKGLDKHYHDQQQPDSDKPVRVLAMDGGPACATYLYYLREIVRANPKFLSKIDVLAGSSDGAILAMYLATRPPWALNEQNALGTVEAMLEFQKIIFQINCPTGPGYVRLLSGCASMCTLIPFQKLLEATFGIGGELSDLPFRVVMPTYKMSGTPPKSIIQANFGKDALGCISPVAAAMQSSAFPILYPLVNGHVDGGMFANNPSLAALAQLESARYDKKNVIIFSLGQDASTWGSWINQNLARHHLAEWGWGKWLGFRIGHPLLLIAAALDAQQKGVSTMLERLLPNRDQYMRLAVPPQFGQMWELTEYMLKFGSAMLSAGEAAAQNWARPENRDDSGLCPNYHQTMQWLKHHWYND